MTSPGPSARARVWRQRADCRKRDGKEAFNWPYTGNITLERRAGAKRREEFATVGAMGSAQECERRKVEPRDWRDRATADGI
jgi:hypothetical protein